jgi:hypothetical protein
MRKRWIPLVLGVFLVFVALGGTIVRLLWNGLLPPLFGFPQITFWQALGLLVLSRILFGGFGFHGSNQGGHRSRMKERWERMTPEERERMRQGWRGRWGLVPPASGREPEAQ